MRQIGERIPTGRILVRRSGPALWGVMQTVVDDLDRRGADVVVDVVGADAWGTSRAASLSDVDEVWVVTEDGLQGVLLEAAPGALVIARTGSLPMDAERELAALQLRLARHLDERGRSDLVPWLDRRDLVELLPEQVPTVDRVETDRIAALLDQLVASAPCRVVVVAFAPDDLPSPLADG